MSLRRKGAKLLRLLASREGRRGLLHGVAMTIEHAPALRGLAPATVVDVGANKGQFALFAASAFPGARIFAFEPLPDAARRFRALFRGRDGVRLFESAIGRRAGEAALHLSARPDSSSLLPIGLAQATHFPGTAEVGTMLVQVAPMDSFLTAADIAAPALLKIDVQGYELEALHGTGSLLACFEWVYVECSYLELYGGQALAPDVADHLRQRGFEAAGRFNLIEDARSNPIQADLLFSRRRGRA